MNKLTIRNKRLVINLPETIETSHFKFKATHVIAFVIEHGARWSVESETVVPTTSSSGRYLFYSAPYNTTSDEIVHTVKITNEISGDIGYVTIRQAPMEDTFYLHDHNNSFQEDEYEVYEIEMVNTSEDEMRNIIEASEIEISNSMFSLHSIVNKSSPIIRLKILKSDLHHVQSTVVNFTANSGYEYSTVIKSNVLAESIISYPTRIHHLKKGHTLPSDIDYDGPITYVSSSNNITVRPAKDYLVIHATPNYSLQPKLTVVSAIIKGQVVQKISIKEDPGVGIGSVMPVGNTIAIEVKAASGSTATIREATYKMNGKVYKLLLNGERTAKVLDGSNYISATIPNGFFTSDKGLLEFTLRLGTKKKRYKYELN